MAGRRSAVAKGSGNPVGKLCYNPGNLNALKCLVAAQMSKSNLEMETIISMKSSTMETSILFERNGDGSQLYDAFSICWLMMKPNKFDAAQILQWNCFAQSEIQPFMHGLMRYGSNKQRHVMFGNKLRKKRLIKSLDVLNEALYLKKHLVGDKMTLADVVLAVELIPLFDPNLGNGFLTKSLFMKDVNRKDYTYIKSWYAAITTRPQFKKAFQQLDAAARNLQGLNEMGDHGKVSKNKKAGNKDRSRSKSESQNGIPSPDMSNIKTPLKILCLHGYRQNGISFKEKLGAFRKLVGKYCDFHFMTAPHHVLPMSAEDINKDQRGWWFSRENDYFKADDVSDCEKGFETSLDMIQKEFELHGPFDGMLGFSQGAALVSLVCQIKQLQPERFSDAVDFKFAIMFASFKSKSTKHAHWYELDGKKLNVPSLHVMGNDDRVINKSLSSDIAELYEKPDTLYHPGGHFVPTQAKNKLTYFRFLAKVNKLCENVEDSVEDSDKAIDENKNNTDVNVTKAVIGQENSNSVPVEVAAE